MPGTNYPLAKKLARVQTALVIGLVLRAGLVAAQNLVTNPGFETGNTSGWFAFGSPSLAAEASQVHSGSYACLVTNRTATWNGIAQSFAALTIWGRVLVRYPVRIDVRVMLRLAAATLAMAIVVLGIVAMPLGAVIKLSVAVPVGALVFLVTSRMFMVLQKDDRRRLLALSALLPVVVGSSLRRLVDFLVPQPAVVEVSR